MPDPELQPYGVESRADRFEVRDLSGRTLLVCRDRGSAAEYAVLLNEAYRRGFRAGYRQGSPPRSALAKQDQGLPPVARRRMMD